LKIRTIEEAKIQLQNYQITHLPNELTDPRSRAHGPFWTRPKTCGRPPRLFRHFRTGGTSHTEPYLRV